MARYRIKVQIGRDNWAWGSHQGIPYEYLFEELAHNAARLWGDAYTFGKVTVVEVDQHGNPKEENHT